jgi:hypothetical protein
MKRFARLACAALASALLAGCAGTSGGGGVAIGYDGFYDDYYGPLTNGYWANDGFFYYMDARGHRHRDSGRHFRHDTAPGFHAFHDRDHDHDRDADRGRRGH